MGVELGKVLAKNILAQLDKPEDVRGHDSSVSALRLSGTKASKCDVFHYRRPGSSTTTRNTGRNK